MTAKELIGKLEKCHPDAEIVVRTAVIDKPGEHHLKGIYIFDDTKAYVIYDWNHTVEEEK